MEIYLLEGYFIVLTDVMMDFYLEEMHILYNILENDAVLSIDITKIYKL
jgi:hypothetical protein